MSVLKQIIHSGRMSEGDFQKKVSEIMERLEPKTKPVPKPKPQKNPEKCIVAKVLKIKKAHVKKGTNVRLAAHQIEAMDKTMTRIVVLSCMVTCLIGGAVGFFTARYFYKKQTWTVYSNGFRSGVIERDLKLQ